jgi:hypothetical protein
MRTFFRPQPARPHPLERGWKPHFHVLGRFPGSATIGVIELRQSRPSSPQLGTDRSCGPPAHASAGRPLQLGAAGRLQTRPVHVRLPAEDWHLPLFGPPNVEKLKANGDAPGLRKALEYPGHWRVRRDAAEALGQIGDAGDVARLVAALRDDTSSVSQAAAEALGQIRDVSAVEPLMAVLKDQSLGVRRAAAEALGQIGDGRALEPLTAALKDASWSVRAAVAEALGHIPDPRAAEILSAATRDRDLNVRQAAIDSLAAHGSQSGGVGHGSQGGDTETAGRAR